MPGPPSTSAASAAKALMNNASRTAGTKQILISLGLFRPNPVHNNLYKVLGSAHLPSQK